MIHWDMKHIKLMIKWRSFYERELSVDGMKEEYMDLMKVVDLKYDGLTKFHLNFLESWEEL
jgi:hypothetical protein